MQGFSITNLKFSSTTAKQLEGDRACKTTSWGVYNLCFNPLDKFINDKAFYEDDSLIILLDGVVLNKHELEVRFGANDIEELARKMYFKLGELFFSEFRGSFSGCLVDKKKDEVYVWTNHYGDSPLFYCSRDNLICICSQFNEVVDTLKGSSIPISLDETAVMSMLAYGFMDENQTYAKEIKRLTAGQYLRLSANGMEKRVYWRLKETSYDLTGYSNAEILENWDILFRQAICREYSKDCEYGYRHLVELSGGLDSRMSNYVAHDLGYTDIVNLNFCQSGCLDETVARSVSKELGHEIILEPLDDAKFLYEIDAMVKLNYGLTLYSGLTGGHRLLNHLNFNEFGLLHTGALGDVVFGSYLSSSRELYDFKPSGLYNPELAHLVLERDVWNNYSDMEEYMLHVRGFNGMVTSHIFREYTTSVAAPFLDIDLLEYATSIPVDKRARHDLYKQWVNRYYPNAAKHVWATSGVSLKASVVARFFSRAKNYVINKFYNRGLSKTGMNPADRWIVEYPQLQNYLNAYFDEHINLLPISDNLIAVLKLAYSTGNTLQKTQVLTAVSAIYMYFAE